MTKLRLKYNEDITLVDSKVGIKTTDPQEKLHVAGSIAGDFIISDTTKFQDTYSGFTPQEQEIKRESSINFDSTTVGTFSYPYETETGNVNLDGNFTTVSEDIIVEDGKIFEVTEDVVIGITTLGTQDVYVPNDSEVSVGTLESVSIQNHFSVPDGGIVERPENPIEGTVRFNDDLNTLEFYNGIEWRQFTVTGASGRGVFGGGSIPPSIATIDYVQISTLGNAQNFGQLTVARRGVGACSSTIRGLFAGGDDPTGDTIDYITIASEGNAIDFGNLTHSDVHIGSLSSSTRGIWAGGTTPANVDIIDYVEISTLGNALDFGNLMEPNHAPSGVSNGVRGVFGGGNTAQPFHASGTTDRIQFITISSKGDAVDFGNLTQFRGYANAASNSIRGVYANGYQTPIFSNTIDYITIATTGNAIDFGDTSLNAYGAQGCATQTRAIISVGLQVAPTTRVNNIEYVEIATTGNSQDFGDLSVARSVLGSCSDSHGGLGGF